MSAGRRSSFECRLNTRRCQVPRFRRFVLLQESFEELPVLFRTGYSRNRPFDRAPRSTLPSSRANMQSKAWLPSGHFVWVYTQSEVSRYLPYLSVILMTSSCNHAFARPGPSQESNVRGGLQTEPLARPLREFGLPAAKARDISKYLVFKY